MLVKRLQSVAGLILLSVFVIHNGNLAQEASVDPTLAHRYFDEMESICRKDGGALWGVSLCGPMLFVDPQTRTVAANQSDSEGNLKEEDGVFIGRFPKEMNIANTSTEWAGVEWTMIMWPLPENEHNRARLMAHESFHRIQDEIGFPGSNPSNAHLDTQEGRVWLQLEWHALRQALLSAREARRATVRDALIFRAVRREIFPDASSEERKLEMNEGLAEYTGMKLCGLSDAENMLALAERLEDAKKRPTFVRSFAYWSGPALGFLLDGLGMSWRKDLKASDDLGILLKDYLNIRLPENLKTAAEERSQLYDGDVIRKAEEQREALRKKRIAEYRARLVDGPVLVIPLQKMSLQFNPSNLLPLDNLGTVYPTMRVTDSWGILEVSDGALMSPDWSKITVPVPGDPDARPLEGKGWILELKDEWKITAGDREGDYVLKGKKRD